MKIEDSLFSKTIKPYLSRLTLWGLYVKNARFLNYAFVCGVLGVLVNYGVYHILNRVVWEPAAFYAAVGVAALSNYTFTVGPYGHLFGLAKENDGVE